MESNSRYFDADIETYVVRFNESSRSVIGNDLSQKNSDGLRGPDIVAYRPFDPGKDAFGKDC